MLKIGEAAKYLGVSKQTLRRWEKSGLINSIRTPSGYRVYNSEELDQIIPKEPIQFNFPILPDLLDLPSSPSNTHSSKFIQVILTLFIITVIGGSGVLLLNNKEAQKPKQILGASTEAKEVSENAFDIVVSKLNKLVGIEPTDKERINDLSLKISSLEESLNNLSNTIDNIDSGTPIVTTTVIDTAPLTSLPPGITYTDLIGKTIIDSFGNVYPSNAALAQTTKPSLGTKTNKYYGLYLNGFSVDTGGNATLQAITVTSCTGCPLPSSQFDSTIYINGADSGTLTLKAADETESYTLTFPDAVGSAGQFLSTNATGVTSWTTVDLSVAGGWTDSGTSVHLTTSTDSVGIGTSTPSTSLDVTGTFQNTNNTSSNSIFNLSSTGDFIIQDNGTAYVTFSDTGTLTLAPTGTGAILDFQLETEWTTGNLINADFGSSTTLGSGTARGLLLDFQTNVTPTAGMIVTVMEARTPAFTQTAAVTTSLRGLILTGGNLVQNTGAGQIAWRGANIVSPGITQTTGTITADGVLVGNGTITTAGTQNLIRLSGTGVGAGTLTGLNIADITGGAGTETAISVGSGWDTDLAFVDSDVIIDGPGGGTLTFQDFATVSGASVTSFSCTDCIDFDDITDSATLDASTAIGFGASSFNLTFTNNGSGNEIHNLSSTGDFVIQDAGSAFATFSDTGAVAFTLDSTDTFDVTSNGSGDITFNLNSTGDFSIQKDFGTFASFRDTGAVAFTLDSTDNPTYTITNNGSGAVITDLAGTGDFIIRDNSSTFATFSDTGAVTFTLDSTDNPTFTITNSGTSNVITNLASTGDFVIQDNGTDVFTFSDTGTLAFAPTGTGTLLDYQLETEWTTGTLINADFGSATTLTGSVTGVSLNFNTNVTPVASGSITGFDLRTPVLTQSTAVTSTYTGYRTISPGALTQNTAAGTIRYHGFQTTIPNITQTTGTISATGINIASGSITTGGTINMVYLEPNGVGAGTLNGVNIESISGGAGTETAISIGSGWDDAININSGEAIIESSGVISLDLESTATTNGLCHSGANVDAATDTTRDVVACSAGPADYAEWYETENNVEFGDLVEITNQTLTYQASLSDPFTGEIKEQKETRTIPILAKATNSSGRALFGIISTSPVEVIGSDVKDQGVHPMPVALNGRVPVKVSTENGPIEKGDFLTVGSLPGIAMKATSPGVVIGKALESYDNPDILSIGKVLVFINVSFADPGNFFANLSLDEEGNLIVPKLKAGKITLPSISTDALDSLQDETQYYDLSGKIASLEERLAELESQQISGSADQDVSQPEASPSGDLVDEESETTDSSELTAIDLLLATESATLANLTVTSEATFSGTLASYDLSVSGIFKALGESVLGATTIAGDLTVDGTLALTGDSISSVDTLYLQNGSLTDSIDIFNGKVIIDKEGKINAQALSLSQESTNTATIPAGQTQIIVSTDKLTSNSKILVTPEKPFNVGVYKDIPAGQFTISLSNSLAEDLRVDWLIVESLVD